MCIAIPGKVESIDGNMAKVDFNGNLVNVNTGIIEPEVGQYVLVHAGCAIEVMEKDKAQEKYIKYTACDGSQDGNSRS